MIGRGRQLTEKAPEVRDFLVAAGQVQLREWADDQGQFTIHSKSTEGEITVWWSARWLELRDVRILTAGLRPGSRDYYETVSRNFIHQWPRLAFKYFPETYDEEGNRLTGLC